MTMKVSVTMKSTAMRLDALNDGEYFVFEAEQSGNAAHGGAARVFVKVDSTKFMHLAAASAIQHQTNSECATPVYLVELTAIEARVVTE